MAERKPLVNYSGTVKEIQNGDTLGVQVRYKLSDESVTNSVTPQNDDELKFEIGANEVWVFRMEFKFSSGASGGFKWVFDLPSGSSGRVGFSGANTSLGSDADIDITVGTGGTTAILASQRNEIFGYVISSNTSGTVQFKWSQNSSSSTPTVIKRCAILVAWKAT